MSDVPLKPWTVLAYIVADHSHLLPEDVPPHIDQIAHEELDAILWHASDAINVAVQVDFTFAPGVLRVIAKGAEREETMLPESSAGRIAPLRNFIDAVALKCPAEHYMLVLWGHGLGPIGFFSDAGSEGDIQLAPDETLSLVELGKVLGHAAQRFGKSIDILLAKSCSVATVEAAWQIGPYVDRVIASQGSVPLKEWSYGSIFEALLRGAVADAPSRVLRAIDRHYRFPVSRMELEEVPYTLLDPRQVQSLATPLNGFAAALLAADPRSAEVRAAIDRARHVPLADPALLDLSALCHALAGSSNSALSAAASMVLSALESPKARLVLEHVPVRSRFNGVGIFYFPPPDLRLDSFANHVTTYDYQELTSSAASNWNLVAFAESAAVV